MEKIRKHFIFHGQVQGVGFRYTAKYLANYLGLTGYVMNNYDGTVIAEVQGDRNAIEEFKASLGNDRFIQIDEIEEKTISVDQNENRFKIRSC